MRERLANPTAAQIASTPSHRWHESIRHILALDHAQAGVGQMEADETRLVCREAVEQAPPRGDGTIGLVVGGGTPVGMFERYDRMGQRVAQDDEAVAAGDEE